MMAREAGQNNTKETIWERWTSFPNLDMEVYVKGGESVWLAPFSAIFPFLLSRERKSFDRRELFVGCRVSGME